MSTVKEKKILVSLVHRYGKTPNMVCELYNLKTLLYITSKIKKIFLIQ